MTWYNKYAVMMLSALAGLGAYEGVCWSRLTASDWGTWFGSVGTVGTLIGTIWIATSEVRRRHRQEIDLALVTAAGLELPLRKMKIAVSKVLASLDDVTFSPGFAVNYFSAARLIVDANVWETADLVALICLPKHIAANLAVARSGLIHCIETMNQAAGNPKLDNAEAILRFNSEMRHFLTNALLAIDLAIDEFVRLIDEDANAPN